jgi:hypothetical protein
VAATTPHRPPPRPVRMEHPLGGKLAGALKSFAVDPTHLSLNMNQVQIDYCYISIS